MSRKHNRSRYNKGRSRIRIKESSSEKDINKSQTLAKLDLLSKKKKIEKNPIKVSSKTSPKFILIGILVTFLMLGGITGVLFVNNGNNSRITDPIDIPVNIFDFTKVCLQNTEIETHYHWQLDLYINGINQEVQTNLGITSNCFRPMHTHPGDDQVHTEIPSGQNQWNPTVEDLFTTWQLSNSNAILTNSSLFGMSGDISGTVNSIPYLGDIVLYVPRNGDQVRIDLMSNF